MRTYIESESLEKRKIQLDLSEWKDFMPKNIPAQENVIEFYLF